MLLQLTSHMMRTTTELSREQTEMGRYLVLRLGTFKWQQQRIIVPDSQVPGLSQLCVLLRNSVLTECSFHTFRDNSVPDPVAIWQPAKISGTYRVCVFAPVPTYWYFKDDKKKFFVSLTVAKVNPETNPQTSNSVLNACLGGQHDSLLVGI